MIVDIDSQVAKITKDHGDTCTVKFLEKRTNSTYCFSTEKTTISKDAISRYYECEKLENTGHFMKEADNVYVYYDEHGDKDFACSDTECESEDESLVDETDIEVDA